MTFYLKNLFSYFQHDFVAIRSKFVPKVLYQIFVILLHLELINVLFQMVKMAKMVKMVKMVKI